MTVYNRNLVRIIPFLLLPKLTVRRPMGLNLVRCGPATDLGLVIAKLLKEDDPFHIDRSTQSRVESSPVMISINLNMILTYFEIT